MRSADVAAIRVGWWAGAETDIQWQQAGGWQRRRDCLDPDEDVTRSLRLIYSHDSSLPTCFVFQILTLQL